MGGGEFFGKVGTFAAGYELDAVVLDDASLDHPQDRFLCATAWSARPIWRMTATLRQNLWLATKSSDGFAE